jgi:putative hydrolase of HD superfamily
MKLIDINKLLNFTGLTNAFRSIERDIPISNGLRHENDSEHSYQLAMVCWYISITEGCSYNMEKIFKYALVHDLPEVLAGDTPLYTSCKLRLDTKKMREKASILKLKEDFKNFDDLHECINKYEVMVDDESRFVYAVDKLLPILSIYLDGGYGWKTHKVSLDSIICRNKNRISVSPEIEKYFNLIIKMIKNKKEFLDTDMIIIKEAVGCDGQRCDIHHVDTDSFSDIPDQSKLKAHAVCMYKGKMLLVNHPEWDIWSIPGGTRESGETIEETLKREIVEETNCNVIDIKPIAYQKVVNPSGEVCHYRLQYLCDVIPLGDFEKDPAGNINKITWIEPGDFESYIENKEFKRLVIRRALELLK